MQKKKKKISDKNKNGLLCFIPTLQKLFLFLNKVNKTKIKIGIWVVQFKASRKSVALLDVKKSSISGILTAKTLLMELRRNTAADVTLSFISPAE